MQPEPQLTVLIPTRDRRSRLVETLRTYATLPQTSFEVVVVDDGSTDGSGEAAEALASELPYPLRVVMGEGRGPAAARNLGIDACRGARVLLTGDDMEPGPETLSEHMRPGEEVRVGSVIWHERVPDTALHRFLAEDEAGLFRAPRQPGETLPFGEIYTANTSLPRNLLAAHRFDEAFRYAAFEDSEWGLRLIEAGARAVAAASTMAHDHCYDLRAWQRRQRRAGWAAALLVSKHPAADESLGVAVCSRAPVPRDAAVEQVIAAASRLEGLDDALERWPAGIPRPSVAAPEKLPALYRALGFAAFRRGIDDFV